MKDFKSYSEEQPKDGGNRDNSAQLLTALVKQFAGKSEGEILKSILEQAEQGKRNGTLTNDDLDNFYTAVAPLFDGFRRQKLKSVINKLKAI